jgi:hypothetical protein
MDFQPGVFVQFKAITKLHLGGTNPPMDVMPGNIIEYDGSTTRIGGQTHNVASIGGAIRLGWLVPLSDNVSRYIPQPAGVQVRPATSASQERGAPMVIERAVDDEHQVGSLGASNARRASALENQFNANTPPAAPVMVGSDQQYSQQVAEPKKFQVIHEDPPVEVTYPLGQADRTKPLLDARTIRVDDSHNEDARPVAQLRPAKMGSIDVSDSRAVNSEMRALDPVTGTKAPIAKVAHTRQGEVEFARSAPDLEDLFVDVEGTPVAPALTWDKSVHWRSRVKTALDQYGNDPGALRQILAQEDPAVVKFIEEGLTKLG